MWSKWRLALCYLLPTDHWTEKRIWAEEKMPLKTRNMQGLVCANQSISKKCVRHMRDGHIFKLWAWRRITSWMHCYTEPCSGGQEGTLKLKKVQKHRSNRAWENLDNTLNYQAMNNRNRAENDKDHETGKYPGRCQEDLILFSKHLVPLNHKFPDQIPPQFLKISQSTPTHRPSRPFPNPWRNVLS